MTLYARSLRSLLVLSAAPTVLGCGEPEPGPTALYRAPAIPDTVDGVVFETGNWEPHLPAGQEGTSWGNHRAVVVLEERSATPEPPPPRRSGSSSRGGEATPIRAPRP